MRLVGLLVVSASCNAVFKLEAPPLDGDAPPTGPTFRRLDTMSAMNSASISIRRESDVEAGDVVFLIVQANTAATTLSTQPPGSTLMTEFGAVGCTSVEYHAWFFHQVVADEAAFDFTFIGPDTLAALAAVYANVGSIGFLRRLLSGTDPSSRTLQIEPGTVKAGSIVALGGVGNIAWPKDPSDYVRHGAVQNVVEFDREVSDGSIPATLIDVPMGFCAGVVQIRIEP